MYDRILKMIDFVENKAPLGRNGITLMRELLCYIRMGMSRVTLISPPNRRDSNLSDLRQFVEEEMVKPVPEVNPPDWYLIALMRLGEDFMTKWLAENRID